MAARAPTAKSLILDLLSTVGRRAVPVRSLVAAAGLFGLEANAVRVALARLRAAELVASDERGFYRLGAGARSVQSQVRGWRDLDARIRPWEGGWVGVLAGALPRGGRADRRRRERALAFLGFRELEPGLVVRPDNLRDEGAGGVTAVRDQLTALGLDEDACVFSLGELDDARDARARTLWDTEALVAGYRSTARELEASAARLETLPREDAMVESFQLGGAAIRQLVFDPLLPDALVPGTERRALLQAMHRYDALGRACWAGALELHDDTTAAPGAWPTAHSGAALAGAVARAQGVT